MGSLKLHWEAQAIADVTSHSGIIKLIISNKIKDFKPDQ
jgi:hypothetical protein